MIRSAADDAVGVRAADDGHLRQGAAIEVDGEEVSFVIAVKDAVSAAPFEDTQGAEGGLRHGELSRPVLEMPGSMMKLVRWTRHPRIEVILLRVVVKYYRDDWSICLTCLP